jgi:hypothetical protein
MVLPVSTGEVSLDLMAAAGCDYLLLAENAEAGWRITGFVYWFEAKGRGLTGSRSCSGLTPRPLRTLPEYALRPFPYVVAMLLGSLRILMAGDPAVPPPIEPGRRVNGGPS